METPVRNTSADATGVSRSGRVRKKSSKLADFESPDEIDTRFKRKTDRPQKSPKIMKVGLSMGADVFDDSDSYIDDDLIEVKDEPLEVDDWVDNDDGDDDMCDDGDDRDDTNDALHVDDDSTDMPRETSNYSLAQSLYFSEKQGKKNIMLKDGQVVRRKKAQRKDKGKSRFTAYMLWAREIRPGIIQANPNMDFSAVNKRLGELWALVPTTQKYNWKRRAKRLAAKGNQKGSMISTGKAAKQSQNAARSNLINKGGVKPQQVIRTPSKQSEVGQSAPATTHKAHTTTPKDVTITDQQGEEPAGDSVVSKTNSKKMAHQKAEISASVTALTVGSTGKRTRKRKVTCRDVRITDHQGAVSARETAVSKTNSKKMAHQEAEISASVTALTVGSIGKRTRKRKVTCRDVTITDHQGEELARDSAFSKTNSKKMVHQEAEISASVTALTVGSTGKRTQKRKVICRDVTVTDHQGEELAGDSAVSKMNSEKMAHQEAEISASVTALTVGSIGKRTRKRKVTCRDVRITDQQGEEPAGDSAVSKTNREKMAHQEAEISASVTALTVGSTGERTQKQKVERKSICSILKYVELEYLEKTGEIFRFLKSKHCESHVEILEDAVRMLFYKKMSLSEAAQFFCISRQRLERVMTVLFYLKKKPTVSTFYKTLEDVMQTTENDKFIEWMLRMRKMGRLPVLQDTHYVKQYLGPSCHPKNVCRFLGEFGEKRVQYEDWCTMTKNSMMKWEEMLKNFLFNEYDIVAEMFLVKENSSRIFNCVEMFLSHTHVANQVVILRGHRNMYNFVCPSRRGIRVMATFSASGLYLKPFFLQKGYHIPLWNDPEFIDQSKFHTGASGNGEIDPLLFVTWLRLFNTELVEQGIEKPVLLLVHGHPCHASLDASTFCKEEGIILYSHYHTPLNVLDPFSRMLSKFYFHYEKSLNVFQNFIGKANLSLKYFPIIFLDAWNKMNDEDLASDAFEKSGLVPFDLSVVSQHLNINLVQCPRSALMAEPLPMFSQKVLPDAGPLPLGNILKVSAVCEPLLFHNYARPPKDPLRVFFEPLLDTRQNSSDVIHVYEKSAQDEQVMFDNDSVLPSTKPVKDSVIESKGYIKVTNVNTATTTAQIMTAVKPSGIKLEQTLCEDILPSQSYESKDACYVKCETSMEEDLDWETIEFPRVYIVNENSTEEHVLPSLSWDSRELDNTRDEHCAIRHTTDCPNSCNCEKIVCDVSVPSPYDSQGIDTDDDDGSEGGHSSSETFECVNKHIKCE
ncbi:uncharacterized protein [Procambarus clarkii]|uniref:uncharacterized protein isoform X1 n=1 Tax=Procambarus clarkii TaxID=6728 RepID=UPI0037434130